MTGGRGFVGSRAVRALRAAGHEPRLPVRSPERAARVFGALGAALPETVVGVATVAAAAGAALDGCDAGLHAAASVAIGRSAAVLERNRAADRNGLGLAAERGLDPIVPVSSVIALAAPGWPPLPRGRPGGEPRHRLRALEDRRRAPRAGAAGGAARPSRVRIRPASTARKIPAPA